LTLGADVDRARFEKVGHELVCTCGCNQVLLECNHVGCTVSDGMRKQVADGIAAGKNDNAVLQGFVAQFGPTVLAAPTTVGFDLLAWLTPFAVFIAGIGIAVYFVRHWQTRFRPAQAYATSVQPIDPLVEQVRRETEL
jgi:cytochrome c-type biogenesis protein CcmH/NrfF